MASSSADETSASRPSNPAIPRFRQSDVFRHIFERVVAACLAAGLVKGEGFAVDASVIEANASRYHGKAPEELNWTEKQRQKRAVAEYLAALEAEATAEIDATDNDAGGGPESKRPRRYERQPPKVISPSDPQSACQTLASENVMAPKAMGRTARVTATCKRRPRRNFMVSPQLALRTAAWLVLTGSQPIQA
jgi:hypothetical protein